MQDMEIELKHRPGAQAEMGEALGVAGISLEGGGVFALNRRGLAHFLLMDASAARKALEAVGMRVVAVRDVLLQR